MIERVHIPHTLHDADAADFISAVEVRNLVDADGYGTDELTVTAAEDLPAFHNEFEPAELYLARVDGRPVAMASYEYQLDESVAWLGVKVLPAFRRQGIGSALAEHIEEVARGNGRHTLAVYTASKDAAGERLPAPTGFGSVPAGNPEVRFLLGRGYEFEQVERVSRLALPIAAEVPPTADGYTLHEWVGSTPDRLLDGFALLKTRMSTDAPSAGMQQPEDVWTPERVLALEEQNRQADRTMPSRKMATWWASPCSWRRPNGPAR